MPLSNAVPGLGSDIHEAYRRVMMNGRGEKQSDVVITSLALDLSSAIHRYMIQALVTTQNTSDPGQPDFPAAGLSNTKGSGTGIGNLL